MMKKLLVLGVAGMAGLVFAGQVRTVQPGGLEVIQRAIDDVAASGGGTVRVPKGTWETKPLFLKSNITLALDEGAVVLGSTNIADYARTDGVCPALVSAQDVTNVTVIGRGATFDGRGDRFYEKYASGADQPKKTPMMMKFARCRNVHLEGFTYRRSGSWGIHLMNCDGVHVKGLTCFNHFNQCNDGIDIESRNVLIEDCDIDADDDSLCFKAESDKNFIIDNVTVRNCRLATTCNFIKFGTGSYKEWRNILIENCTLHRASVAHRFHWDQRKVPGVKAPISGLAGLALELVDGGRMQNVTIRNITMEDGVGTPLFIRLARRHPNTDGGGSYFKNVLVENVKMLKPAESRIASSITGVPGMRLSGVTVRNCDFLFPGGGTAAEAADHNIPEVEKGYPEYFGFGFKALPAYGIYLRHVDGVKLENVKLRLASPDRRLATVYADPVNLPHIQAYLDELARPILPPGAQTNDENAVLARFVKADEAADAAWCGLAGRAAYDAYRTGMRQTWGRAMGGLDELERTPLRPRVAKTTDGKGHRVEKVLFESRPGCYVSALLWLPDPARFAPPYRAIVIPCGHSQPGKGEPLYQRGGLMAAEAGFAAFCYDPIGQGERCQGPREGCCLSHDRYGTLAELLGQSCARQRIWDGMRAIDYLMTRDDICKDGVGCMGNSGGGTMTSLLESMDPRITTACPSCYITTLRDVCRRIGPQDAEQNIFGQLAFGLNHAGYVLMGGNAVRIHCCFKDFFWIEGTRASYDVVKKTVANCGLDATRYGLTDVPGPHGWKESTRTSSIQWMRRWLAGDTSTPPVDVEACRKLDVGFDVKKVDHGLDGKAVWVTPEGKVAKVPGFRSIYALLKDDLVSAEKARPVRDAAARAQVAAARAGIRPLEQLGVRVTKVGEEKLADGATLVREIFSFADGQKVPALTFLPKGEVKGAVLVVDDRPQRSIHRARVPDVLKRGEAIMVADLACVGETGKVKFPFYGIKNADEGPAVMLYLLGKSMVGLRAEELVALGDALKARTGKKVEMIPHGRPCISAAHAFAVRPDLFKSVQCLRSPKSWGESVRTSAMVPYADVVNGALLDYDWTDLLK